MRGQTRRQTTRRPGFERIRGGALAAVPSAGPGDPADLSRDVPQRGADVVEPYLVRSRDVRPRPAVDSCVGRYIADAEFIGQLLICQAVRPPCP